MAAGQCGALPYGQKNKKKHILRSLACSDSVCPCIFTLLFLSTKTLMHINNRKVEKIKIFQLWVQSKLKAPARIWSTDEDTRDLWYSLVGNKKTKTMKGKKKAYVCYQTLQSYSCMWLTRRENKTAGEDKRIQRRKGRILGESNEFTGGRWWEPVEVLHQ